MNRPVARAARFYAIVFVVTWFFWIALYQTGVLSEPAARIAGTWAPTLTALVLVAAERGRSGIADLMRRLLRWRVHPGWYAFALGATAVVVVAAIGVHRALGGTVIEANDPSQWYLVFPGLVSIFFVSVLGEEVGWRGYALPLLQRRYGPLRASLVIGLLWGLWHLPLWWMGENFHGQIPFVLFVIENVALSIILTWVYNRTGGSLLLVLLLHAASNLTIGVAPLLPEYTGGSTLPLWLSVALACAGAAVIAVRWASNGDRPVVV